MSLLISATTLLSLVGIAVYLSLTVLNAFVFYACCGELDRARESVGIQDPYCSVYAAFVGTLDGDGGKFVSRSVLRSLARDDSDEGYYGGDGTGGGSSKRRFPYDLAARTNRLIRTADAGERSREVSWWRDVSRIARDLAARIAERTTR